MPVLPQPNIRPGLAPREASTSDVFNLFNARLKVEEARQDPFETITQGISTIQGLQASQQRIQQNEQILEENRLNAPLRELERKRKELAENIQIEQLQGQIALADALNNNDINAQLNTLYNTDPNVLRQNSDMVLAVTQRIKNKGTTAQQQAAQNIEMQADVEFYKAERTAEADQRRKIAAAERQEADRFENQKQLHQFKIDNPDPSTEQLREIQLETARTSRAREQRLAAKELGGGAVDAAGMTKPQRQATKIRSDQINTAVDQGFLDKDQAKAVKKTFAAADNVIETAAITARSRRAQGLQADDSFTVTLPGDTAPTTFPNVDQARAASDMKKLAHLNEQLQVLQTQLKASTVGSAEFKGLQGRVNRTKEFISQMSARISSPAQAAKEKAEGETDKLKFVDDGPGLTEEARKLVDLTVDDIISDLDKIAEDVTQRSLGFPEGSNVDLQFLIDNRQNEKREELIQKQVQTLSLIFLKNSGKPLTSQALRNAKSILDPLLRTKIRRIEKAREEEAKKRKKEEDLIVVEVTP